MISFRGVVNRIKGSLKGTVPASPEDGTVRVGKDTSILESRLDLHTSIGERCFLYRTSIGSFSYLSQNVSVMNTSIGKYCSIAQGTVISGGMHPVGTFVSTSPVFYSVIKQCGDTFADQTYFREMGTTTIGNDVWIGANAVVKDDVVIGDGAIIGAGTIVTKNIPPYAIVLGCPGRVVRYRFTEEQIEFLLKFRWWEKDEEWVRTNYKDFHDIAAFMRKYESPAVD